MRDQVRQCPECMAVNAFYKAMKKEPPANITCQTCKGRGVVKTQPIVRQSKGLKYLSGPEWIQYTGSEWELINDDFLKAAGLV